MIVPMNGNSAAAVRTAQTSIGSAIPAADVGPGPVDEREPDHRRNSSKRFSCEVQPVGLDLEDGENGHSRRRVYWPSPSKKRRPSAYPIPGNTRMTPATAAATKAIIAPKRSRSPSAGPFHRLSSRRHAEKKSPRARLARRGWTRAPAWALALDAPLILVHHHEAVRPAAGRAVHCSDPPGELLAPTACASTGSRWDGLRQLRRPRECRCLAPRAPGPRPWTSATSSMYANRPRTRHPRRRPGSGVLARLRRRDHSTGD